MPGVNPVQLSVLTGVCVSAALLLVTGAAGSVCSTTLESLDLGCLLRWNCPHAGPNTTYTVQTKTQGDSWQDVAWCVWVSSHSCDMSQVFSDFELYNMIRLGVHLSPSSTVWTEPRKFDYSDFTFSPPSVSVSLLHGDQLSVQVQFPCATSRRCSLQSCCPVSELIDPWTTVTVYNQRNRTDYQRRTVWTQDVLSRVEFSGLAPGQNYCAVANFSFPSFSMAASPRSRPQCVQTAAKSGWLSVCLGIGLCSVVVIPPLVLFLPKRKQAEHTTEHLPTPLAYLQDPVCLVPLPLVPVDPCDIYVEVVDDHISIVSSSGGSCGQDRTSSPENSYCVTPFHSDSAVSLS